MRVPPSALRGRSWCVGVVAAPPLHTTQHWPLICQVNCTSSGAFLATESLTRPHCCSLHSQQQSFPWGFPLNPEFQPACASGCGSQAGECKVVVQATSAWFSLFCLLQTGGCALLGASEALFLSRRLIFLPARGLPECRDLSSFSASSQGAGPTPLPVFFFVLSYPVTRRSFLSFHRFEVS